MSLTVQGVIVDAAFDASKYVAGAALKTAADKAMVATDQLLQASIDRTSDKIRNFKTDGYTSELAKIRTGLETLAQSSASTNEALGRIADNTDRSFTRIATQAAVAAVAYTAVRGVIIDTADAVKAAVPAAFGLAVDAVAGFATGVAVAGAAIREFATGGLAAHLTPQAMAAAEAVRTLTLAQGQTAATMLATRDAANATGLGLERTAGVFSHLTSVITGTDAAAEEARATARAFGVELSGLGRNDAPTALQDLIGKFQGFHDSAAKTAAILQVLGASGPGELKALAGASDFTSDAIRRNNELVAELDLRIKQHAADLEELKNRPSWWDRQVAGLRDLLRLGDEFNNQLKLIAESGQHAEDMLANRGVAERFKAFFGSGGTDASNDYAAQVQANRDQLRLFASRIFPSLVEPPAAPYIQQDLRPEAPDPFAAPNAAYAARLRSGYATQAEYAGLDPRDLAVQKARDAASTSFLGGFKGQLTEAGQADLGDLQEQAAKLAGQQYDTTQLEKLTAAFKSLAESLNPLVAANAKATESQQVINDMLAAGQIAADEAAIATTNLAAKYKDALDPIGAVRDRLDEERKALDLTGADRALYNDMLRVTNELKQKGVDLDSNPAARDAIKSQLADIERVKEDQAAALKAQQEFERVARHTTDTIIGYGQQAIESIFNSSRIADFFKSIERIAVSAFSRIAAEALLRPIVQPFVTAFLGSTGLASLGSAAAFAAAGAAGGSGGSGAASSSAGLGLGGLLNIGGLASSAGSFLGLPSLSSLLPAGGVLNALGLGGLGSTLAGTGGGFFAGSAGGFAPVLASGAGPLEAGSAAFTGASAAGGISGFAGLAGGVGGGFALGNLLAMIGGHSTQGLVGSGLGALGGAGLGFALGGPVGALLGGLVGGGGGGLLGGLIGPGAANNAAGFNYNTATGANGFAAKGGVNVSAAQGLQGSVGAIIAQLLGATGGSLAPEFITGDVSNKIGTRLQTFDLTSGQATNTFTGPEALASLADHLLHNLSGLSDEMQKIVDGTAHFADLGASLKILQAYDALSTVATKSTQAADAYKALGQQLVDTTAAIAPFGLSVEKLRAGMAANLNQSIQDQIQAIENPRQAALDQEKLTADERLAVVKKLGADEVAAARLTADEIAQIQNQYLGNLKGQLNGLLFGSGSTLTGAQQYRAASASFAAAEAQTAAGTAPTNLGDTINTFLATSRAANASSPAYAADFARATAAIQTATGGPGADSGVGALAKQINALGGLLAKTFGDAANQNDARFSLIQSQIIDLQSQMVRLLSKVAAA